MGVHKSGFFLKACSLNCLKMQSLRVFRSYMRWKKLGPDYPLKEFHDGKIRILARSDPRRRKIALPPLGNQKGCKKIQFSHSFWQQYHFWSFWGHFWPFSFPEIKLSQTSRLTTQNDRKRGRILMGMFSKIDLHTFRPFQAISCPFQGYLGPIWAIFGPGGKIVAE